MVDHKVSHRAILLGALLMGLLRVVDLAHADDRPVFDSPSAAHEYVGRQILAHFQSEMLKDLDAAPSSGAAVPQSET